MPVLPKCLSGFSPGTLFSSHIPNMCIEVNWCVQIVLICVSVGVSVPCDGRTCCPGWVPALHSDLLGEAPAT